MSTCKARINALCPSRGTSLTCLNLNFGDVALCLPNVVIMELMLLSGDVVHCSCKADCRLKNQSLDEEMDQIRKARTDLTQS